VTTPITLTICDNAAATGNVAKLRALHSRWSRRAERWERVGAVGAASLVASVAFDAAADAVEARLVGNIARALERESATEWWSNLRGSRFISAHRRR
jgi:hypothetical protein